MAHPLGDWHERNRTLVALATVVLLVAVVAIQAYLIVRQSRVERSAQAQSAKLLTTFLQGDTLQAASAASVRIHLKNVRFQWTDKVYIDTDDMAVRAVPVHGTMVNFDDPQSFVFSVQHTVVEVSPAQLEGMFNESVFNYPESRVRDLKVSLVQEDSVYSVRIKGSLNMIAWIPFNMETRMSADPASNSLVINVTKLKVLGFIPAMKLIKLGPLHLDKIIAVPPNKSLLVVDNKILLKALALFPPPRIKGQIMGVSVDAQGVRLAFGGAAIPAPVASARNYVYLQGGSAQFGHIQVVDGDVLISDADPSDRFVFSLTHYAELLPKSRVAVPDTRTVRVEMPDY